MNWLRKSYRSVVDHLTKALGAAGASLMSVVIFIDPQAVRDAAQTYLGENAAAKVGLALFVLVMVRGWYTGRKHQEVKQS